MKCDICYENEACRTVIQPGYDANPAYLCEGCYEELMEEMFPEVEDTECKKILREICGEEL